MTGTLPPWATCLDFDRQPADHYQDFVFLPLFKLMRQTPRRVLELGCADGAFGAELKRRYPGATVVGIDAGRAAAERAATRLDRVVHAPLDGFDFAAAGFQPGEFDTVIAADILEHLVNPWDLLARMKDFLSGDAQVISSIPNVRNVTVAATLLAAGKFDYAEHGLLDITHLRFFTVDGMKRLFLETGYAVEAMHANIAPALKEMHDQYQRNPATSLRMGRLTIHDLTPEDVTEFCAQQYVVRARPA